MANDKQALIDALNEDLAGEYGAIIQYITYAATVTGPFRSELRALFLAEVPDEQKHAQFLADQITFLGGTPTTTPREVPAANSPRMMLERIAEAEERAVHDYTARAEQAARAGEIALKIQLENQITDESTHMQEVRRMLAGWSDTGISETTFLTRG